MACHVTADFIFTGAGFESGQVLSIGDDGRVLALGSPPPGGAPAGILRLAGRVLLPGMVNAHSHAFQRAIRGRVERPGPDDFWSWRTPMYDAALRLTAPEIEVVSRLAFIEMLKAGVTSVGEFHYLHNRPDGAPPNDETEDPDDAVLRAAEAAGIRITLLRAAYARAGFARSTDPMQRRFVERSPEIFLARLERLAARWRSRSPRVTFGVAPHSVRAVDGAWIETLADFARRHAGDRALTDASFLPLHVHAGEQPREVREAVDEHGAPPILALERAGLAGLPYTAVHAIHVNDEEIAALSRPGVTVAACPVTERNLGDGAAPIPRFLAAGVRLCLGSDSQAEINQFEEMRTLEYNERLKQGRRILLLPPGARTPAEGLFACATVHGAGALGLAAGTLVPVPGAATPWADFYTVDLSHPTIAGADADPDTLLDAVVFGASPAAVRDVCVAGDFVVRDGHHRIEDETVREFRLVMRRLCGRP
ncbi:MAG: formimidoylglutamate deiminase [Planctomycetes bacterium]|nr:formimidoylglutamate deiminase [Planctomycetota bacterium]